MIRPALQSGTPPVPYREASPPLVRATSRGIDWSAVGIALAAAGLCAAALWLCTAGGASP